MASTTAFDVFLKKAEYELRYRLRRISYGRDSKTVLFYPEYPSKRAIIYKMMNHLKFNVTNNPRHSFNIAINWKDTTFREHDKILNDMRKNHRVLNIRCTDISKENVNAVFDKVFGYRLNVDPRTYVGKCVKKSNLNARHNGEIIYSPVKVPEKDFVYQKILDNRFDDQLVYDIRVPVVKDTIPFVYLKFKKIEERFTNNIFKSALEDIEHHLSAEELKQILQFCPEIGLDYGELDIIRNKADNRIYIVDVNNTPWGPPFRLPENDGKFAIDKLSELFMKKFMEE